MEIEIAEKSKETRVNSYSPASILICINFDGYLNSVLLNVINDVIPTK